MTTSTDPQGAETAGVLPHPAVVPFLKPHEAMPFYRIGEVQMYPALAAGEIPAFRIGTSWRIPTAEVWRVCGMTPPPLPTDGPREAS